MSGRELTIALIVGIGGIIGALGRYLVLLAIPTRGGRFPWGTFIINVSGSILLGFILVLILEQFQRGNLARPLLGTGILGGYTTFSTFTVDSALLVHGGRPMVALVYIAATLICGLFAMMLGMLAGRLLLKIEAYLQEERQ